MAAGLAGGSSNVKYTMTISLTTMTIHTEQQHNTIIVTLYFYITLFITCIPVKSQCNEASTKSSIWDLHKKQTCT